MADRKRIERKDVEQLGPSTILWDGAIPGFGVRRQFAASPRYVLKYRTLSGRQRWITIGQHGTPWTVEEARREAMRLLTEIAAGRDPEADKEIERALKGSRKRHGT